MRYDDILKANFILHAPFVKKKIQRWERNKPFFVNIGDIEQFHQCFWNELASSLTWSEVFNTLVWFQLTWWFDQRDKKIAILRQITWISETWTVQVFE